MEKISVSIRVRPLDKQEAAKGSFWKINNNAITLCGASGAPLPNQVFNFDHVFDVNATTSDVYRETTQDIVASAVKGFNGTVFAYGQTSSGKTFTMRGTQDMLGIIPLAIQDVFKNLEQAVDREFLLRVSYMEIYNEDINDLLAPEQTKLQVHESLERGIFVAGLREEIVVNPEQVLQLMEFGEAHRHIGETNMNVHSSRSHTIFRMIIESRDKSQDDSMGFSCDAVRVSVLNLVDLAGSERVAKTGAEGARLKEGTHINKSLMVLGTVINKLSEGIQNQGGHVPYRDSKLTRILQSALGGNARTAVICNITPASVHVDESRGTLQFASRAIRVTNCAQVNEILTDAALLKRQKKEIEELRSKLKESHSEHFEEEILTLRNTLLKSECERERIALELQEEKRAHAERERKQAQKIENLSSLVLNSTVDDREFDKRTKKSARRETWCPRVTTANIFDEIDGKPSKEDRWADQSRDRLFPMPPPFESLLEEDESLTEKESTDTGNVYPKHQEIHAANTEVDSDALFCAVPDVSARIHVADRKRKHCSGMPSISEMPSTELEINKDNMMETVSSPKENQRFFQSQNTEVSASMEDKNEEDLRILVEGSVAHLNSPDPIVQQLSQELREARDNALQYKSELALALEKLGQLNPQLCVRGEDTGLCLESMVKSLTEEKEGLATQLTEAYLHFEEEKAAWAAVNGAPMGEELTNKRNKSEHAERVKFLEEKLLETQEEIYGIKVLAEEERLKRVDAQKEALALRERVFALERELDTLKANEVSNKPAFGIQDCNEALISEHLIDAELLPEVLDGTPKEPLEVINSVFLKSQNKGKLDTASIEGAKASSELGVSHFGGDGDGRESASQIQEIHDLRRKIIELEKFIVDLKSENAENVRELKISQSKAEELERKAAALSTIADQETVERTKTVPEIAIMRNKIIDLETKLLDEKVLRDIECEEARNLRRKVRSMENDLSCSKAESTKETWILKTEILKLQVSLEATTARAEVFHGRLLEAQDELKDVSEELDHLKGLSKGESKGVPMIAESSKVEMLGASVCNAGHDGWVKNVCAEVDIPTSRCMKDEDNIAELSSCNVAGNGLVHTKSERLPTVGKDRKEWTKVSLSENLAHTVSLPIRSSTTRRPEQNGATGEGQGQSRNRLSALNGNAADFHNRGTAEAEAMPASGKNAYSAVGSQKPPKALLPQRNAGRVKGWPATNMHNKENR